MLYKLPMLLPPRPLPLPPLALPMLSPRALHLISPLKVEMQHVHQHEISVLSLLENERKSRK